MLFSPFTGFQSCFLPCTQSAKQIHWHLKTWNLSWILTVNTWHFWRTSDETKKVPELPVKSTKHRAKLLLSSPLLSLSSQFQPHWLWYQKTTQECFSFGTIVYPRQGGSNWRGCGDCWIGMRLRGRGAAGWQQDQTHRGQSSLERPGWGVGASRPQVSRDTLWGRVVVYVTVVYAHVWSKAHACLESMHIIMWVCFIWIHTHWASGGREWEHPIFPAHSSSVTAEYQFCTNL